MENTKKNSSISGAGIAAALLVLSIVVTMAVLFINPWKKPVTNFAQCKAAGGAILESYPEQCLYEGKTYVNETQRLEAADESIGLSENEALDAAQQSNIPARIVERDGEALPITMDFVFGRRNLYVKDGRVYKVEVEGEANDTN